MPDPKYPMMLKHIEGPDVKAFKAFKAEGGMGSVVARLGVEQLGAHSRSRMCAVQAFAAPRGAPDGAGRSLRHPSGLRSPLDIMIMDQRSRTLTGVAS